MDGNKDYPREGEGQAEHQHLADLSLAPSKEASLRQSTSVSSLDSQDSALGTDADDPPSDMDSAGDTYRRRRAQMMASLGNGSVKGKNGRGQPRRHKSDDKHLAYSSDDGQASDFSYMSTSDDVELSHMASEDAMTDDEEAGLTKKDKEHRKRKRRRNTRLDRRIAGNANAKSSKQEHEDADRNVIKAMIINVLLIVSWYIFSLSISIVGQIARNRANDY